MIYISIPKGMVFAKIVSRVDGSLVDETRDCFVDSDKTKPNIELQYLIKEALRTNNGRNKRIELKDFTIYLRTPPKTADTFLAYSPNHNGKYPTEIVPTLVTGYSAQKFDPKQLTQYGSFWYQQLKLSSDKQQEIDDRMLAQRENRRHIGDSPSAT